jgi:hypothetical protein
MGAFYLFIFCYFCYNNFTNVIVYGGNECNQKKNKSPRRSNPISRSDRFQSNPRRISSETDIFHKKPIGSDMVFVGFRPGFYRNLTESDEIRVGFHRVPSNSDEIRAGFRPIGIRQKPCRIRQRLFRSDPP